MLIETLSKKELLDMRRSIGMIFQNFNLFDQRTVLDNVSFPLSLTKVPKDKQKEKALELLKIVGLDDRKNYYPSQLSGGEKQRLAIARALIQKTKIILFDEATSALDNITQSKIEEAINNLRDDYTILIIAHRLSTIINADRILFLEDGHIKAEGNHKELMKKSSGYKQLYEKELSK